MSKVERATPSSRSVRRKARELRFFWEELFSSASDVPDGSLYHYMFSRGSTRWFIKRYSIRRVPALQVIRYGKTNGDMQADGVDIICGNRASFSYSRHGVDSENAKIFPLQTDENTDTAYKMIETFGDDFSNG